MKRRNFTLIELLGDCDYRDSGFNIEASPE